MGDSNLEQRLRRAEERVREYLDRYGGELPSLGILLDPELDEETMATNRYPGTVVVRETSVPESVIAHELVHIAQGTLEQFRGFRLLYTLLAEGLADWVAKQLYPEHEVKYQAGYRLVQLLRAADEEAIGGLLRLNHLPLMPEDVETILTNPHLAAYSRDLLSPMAGRIRDSIRTAIEAGIADPTFVTLGEELRAWKFVLDGRWAGVREEVDQVVGEWFGQGNSSQGGDQMNEMGLQKASEWMLARGWKRKIAKRRQFDQSLFEHSLVELDAALQLLPILRQPSHFDLTPEEEQVLVVSLVAHDVGKERPEWQDYILGQRGFLSDIDPVLTKSVLPDLCTALGFPSLDQKVMAVIENCVNLHMSHERRDTNVILAMLQGTDRWYTLANLVYHIDNVCSAKGVFEARNALERSLLGKHLKTACHQVIIRGVSTTALHRAALESFQEAGWTPLLHFSDATLYVCSAAQLVADPTPAQIEQRLAKVLDESIGRDVAPLVVGNEMQNFLPKPDLFDYREIKVYLVEASKRANPFSFRKKPREYRHNVVAKYLSLRGDIFEELNDSATDLQSERIGSARSEMAVFRFFKNAMGSDLIGEDGVSVAEQEYDAIFGQGAWNDLKSMSTYMPAPDMAKRVDRFWKLPGKQFRLDVVSIEELAPERRVELLIDTLTGIANKVYAAIPNPPTRATLAREMAAGFIQDLVSPAKQIDLAELARQQMEFYAASKPFAGKQTKKARYVCPICNTPFEEGTKAAADFVDKPESHTNRGVAHGPFGYITICNTCKYERLLRQLLLGERAAELIVIFPRMNIGPGAGELLMRKAQTLYDRAYALMVGDTDDPDRRLWLAFTPFIADQVLDQDLYRLTPGQLVDLLAYRSGEEIRRKNRRQLEKSFKEAYEDDLEGANTEWGTDFDSWDEAIAAVCANRVSDPTARGIRTEVYRLYPQMRLVCQTPHMIMLPVSYSIKLGEDSETNAALRRTFVALLLGLSLDVSVAIVRDSDKIDFQGGEGIAFVPPVAAARELIGSNWMPLSEAERWFRRIGVASILASAGQYSDRSGLFEVLTAPTAGHVLRRIEQKRAGEKQPLRYQDIAYLRIFEEVMQL